MLLKASLEVLPEDQAESLSLKLADLGGVLLIETLQNLHQIKPTPQDHSQFTYAPIIPKELWQIDWTKSAIALHHQIRGFYPNCYTTLRNQRLKIMATEVSTMYNIPNPPGTIYYIEKISVLRYLLAMDYYKLKKFNLRVRDRKRDGIL